MINDDGAWFLPKRHGYGAGMPIAWQGWAVLAAYLIVVISASFLFEPTPYVLGAVLFVATAALLVVAAAKTRGGWRWRSGED